MSKTVATYQFRRPTACAMCGSPEDRWRILGRRLDRSQGWVPWRVAGAATTVVRCKVCGLVFAKPMPIPGALTEHYDMEPEAYFYPEHTAFQDGVFQWEIQRARELLALAIPPAVLDVGAGTGKVMAALKNAGFDVWGIEPSPTFRKRALEQYALDPTRLQQVWIEEASFPPDSFDFVTFGAVLEHLLAPGDAIKRALLWLRPGGLIHAEVPSSRWLVGRLLTLGINFEVQHGLGN